MPPRHFRGTNLELNSKKDFHCVRRTNILALKKSHNSPTTIILFFIKHGTCGIITSIITTLLLDIV